jgi:hypothetical protein
MIKKLRKLSSKLQKREQAPKCGSNEEEEEEEEEEDNTGPCPVKETEINDRGDSLR